MDFDSELLVQIYLQMTQMYEYVKNKLLEKRYREPFIGRFVQKRGDYENGKRFSNSRHNRKFYE